MLLRDKFRRFFSAQQARAVVELVQLESTVLRNPSPIAAPLGQDPGDEYLITRAGAARVDALVSGDPHLLRLRSKIPLMNPTEFLDWLARAEA